MIATSRLRVLAVTNMYPTLGDPTYGNFVASQMESIERAGASVEVCFIDGRDTALAYPTAIPRVRSAARRGEFDVVHAHYGLCGFVASFQALPLVVSFCGDDLLGTPDGHGGLTAKSRLIRYLSGLAARRADGIICKSEGLRGRLPRAADRLRAAVIPNGVDTSRFSGGDRLLARRRLALEPEDKLVLFPHNRGQQPRKRFDLAEAALQMLQAQGIAARLWVVNGVAPGDMPDYYRASDCVLLTSDHEGSPNVVKEALCCGTPVVSVDAGDVRWWLELVPGCELVGRDPAAIASGIRAVLDRASRVDASRVRAELAISRIAERILEVYREAIDKRRSTRGCEGPR
jgi:glycosyltransferase involved in cell wall biosynthesis